MIIDDAFEELYKQIRGSRCAPSFLEAKQRFDDGDVEQSLDLLVKLKSQYENTRKSTLSKEIDEEELADRKTLKVKERQDKTKDALSQFSELIGMLTAHSRRLRVRDVAASSVSPQEKVAATPVTCEVAKTAPLAVPSSEVIGSRAKDEFCDALLKLVSQNLSKEVLISKLDAIAELKSIASMDDLSPNAKCIVISGSTAQIVQIEDPSVLEGSVRLRILENGQKLAPIPVERWLHAASKSKVMLLEQKLATVPKTSTLIAEETKSNEVLSKPTKETLERDQILDMGAFTQLLDAAQRCGLVPGLANITQVRDCEFRLGKYAKGLQMMESMYASLLAADAQRNQRLQREDAEIASGRRKISPKELQAKRVQDNHTTQAIERAKTRFQRVLEGLRGILHLENTTTQADGSGNTES